MGAWLPRSSPRPRENARHMARRIIVTTSEKARRVRRACKTCVRSVPLSQPWAELRAGKARI